MDITIRKGGVEDTETFIRMTYQVQAMMNPKEWLYLDPPEFTRDMMQRGMMELWVAEVAGEPAGVLSIIRPGFEECNYGYDLGFDREMLLRVVNMDTAVVLPEYRGRGLQKRLLETAENALREEGGRILLCTIHPENRFSLNNALKQGYVVRKELHKYDSVRYVLRKDV